MLLKEWRGAYMANDKKCLLFCFIKNYVYICIAKRSRYEYSQENKSSIGILFKGAVFSYFIVSVPVLVFYMNKNYRYKLIGSTIVKHTRKKKKRNVTKEFWDKEEYSPPVFIGKQPPKKDIRNYKEKLKDIKWKRKRDEIFKRDNYTCRCGSRMNVQVHHKKYVWGKEPWDYPNEDLITLCKMCHKKEHK